MLRPDQSFDIARSHRHGAPPRGLRFAGEAPRGISRSAPHGKGFGPFLPWTQRRPRCMFRRKTCRRSRRSEGHAMFKSLAFAGLLLALLPDQVSAQAPAQAQRDAIRAACRSDFMANCSGVQPGGKEAFECLLRNDAKLSPSCQAAVNAAPPKPAEAAEPAAPATASSGAIRDRATGRQSRTCTAGDSGCPDRSPERRAQGRAAGLHPQRLGVALLVDCAEQSGNFVVSER